MKKSLYLIVLLFASWQTLSSQSWFAPENNWVYRSSSFEYNGYAEANIIGDTVVHNMSSKIMKFAYAQGNPFAPGIMNYEIEYIVYEKNDSVYYLNSLNEFKLIYDFTMTLGDTTLVYGEIKGVLCDEPNIYRLDSISLLTNNTDTFRVQHMTVTEVLLNDTFSEDIIEFIGSVEGSFILPENHYCLFDAGVLQLCSFENNVSNFQFLEDVDCYKVITSNKETELNKSIHVYPNPSDGNYFIDIEVAPTKIEVLNIKGQIVATSKKSKHLDLSYLESGSYFLKIWTEKNIHVEKIMVH